MQQRGTWRVRMYALWIPSVLWMGVIFRVSSVPGSRLPGGPSALAHFVSYAVLGALLVVPLRRLRGTGEAIAIAVLIASLYGITDEFHQTFVPLRTPDVADWGVDTLGALAGAYACAWIADTFRRRLDAGRRP